MACSKVFSGDLPELTNEIIQYFKKDFSTLYSCILVNRLLCRLAIPLLWEDPFSIPSQNYRCIEIYLHFLNEDSKAKFNEYGINNNILSTDKTLFNYPSFIKYLNTHYIYYCIKKWVIYLMKYNHKRKRLVTLIYRSLFEVFVENEGNLHSFETVISDQNIYDHNAMDLILQNPNLTYNIKNLKLGGIEITIPFLEFLNSNCNSISSIGLDFPIDDINKFSLIEKHLSQIIISQHNLKKISFESDITLFLSLKTSNCSNTLNTIIFYSINFKNIINNLREVFDQLNVLESIHILKCNSLNSDFVQQIIKVIKPFKLRSLFMSEILYVESFQFLLQKFGNWLENFGFGFMNDDYNGPRRQLLKLIMKYCKNIRYFESGIPDDINIYPFIENNHHNINYISIKVRIYNYSIYNQYSSTVLQNLGQVLPSKLEYLCLTLSFMTDDLEIFLRNSQNTFIKKLLIRYMVWNEGKHILSYIKEFITEKKRVKYLAISEFGPGVDNELFSSKDKFKFHNVVVRRYNDLYITPYNFITNNLQYSI
ncbi:hypothetical protein RhiirB3_436691 [Rhizophagus irregularis]|nr:hypothetical protein RhiirB3_436691 [Rhizophagus irregularis]